MDFIRESTFEADNIRHILQFWQEMIEKYMANQENVKSHLVRIRAYKYEPIITKKRLYWQ